VAFKPPRGSKEAVGEKEEEDEEEEKRLCRFAKMWRDVSIFVVVIFVW